MAGTPSLCVHDVTSLEFTGESYGARLWFGAVTQRFRRYLYGQRGRHGSIDLAINGAEGLQPQGLSTVLRCSRNRSRAGPQRRGPSCLGIREAGKACRGVAALSGVHLLQRIVPEGIAPHRSRCPAGRAFAELHGDVAGGGGISDRKSTR